MQADIEEGASRARKAIACLRGMDKIFYGEDESDTADSTETIANKEVAEAI